MRKILVAIIALILTLTAVTGLAACGDEVEFDISFVVDGQVYATVTTMGEEVISMPNDPTKEGYVFDGWYWDEGSWKRPFTASSLVNEPLSDNMSVYAKWLSADSVQGTEATFEGFTKTDEDTYSIRVESSKETLSLESVVTVDASSTWVLTTDIYGNQTIASKTAPLAFGDNVYYVLVTAEDGSTKLYTLNIKRNHVYTVSFDANGGEPIAPITVEEGRTVSAPSATRTGYDVYGWSYDFSTPVTENITVTVYWTPKTYTLTLDTNGGEGQGSLEVTYGGEYSLPTPTRTGYEFDGWYVNGDEYDAGSWDIDGALTFRAEWTAIEYTITYRLMGGELSDAVYTYTVEDEFVLPTPTLGSTVFLGWTGEGITDPTAEVLIQRGSVGNRTYTANWDYDHYITYHLDGGENDPDNPTGFFDGNEAIVLDAPTKPGYDFVGWYTDASLDGAYLVTEISANYGADVELYASWQAKRVDVTLTQDEFSISFDLNGADGVAPDSQYVTAANGLTYPTVPTRAGYIFKGWYTTPDCTGEPYDFSDPVSATVTLYAGWIEPEPEYIVINVGTSSDEFSFTQTYTYFTFVSLRTQEVVIYTTHTSADPYIVLYNSNRDQLASDDDSAGSVDARIVYTVNAGEVYYVGFRVLSGTGVGRLHIDGEPIPEAGGTAQENGDGEIVYGESFTLSVPTRDGYTFGGWFDAPGGRGTQYTDENGNGLFPWDKTDSAPLYAYWIPFSYEVTFDKQTGVGGTDSVTATSGAAMPEATAPTKDGYTFLGYYSSPVGGVRYYNANMTSARPFDIASDTVLYAHWELTRYPIYLDSQGGYGGRYVYAYIGQPIPETYAPTREGYIFLGYYDAPVGGNCYYDANMQSEVVWNSTSGITLYAHWEARTFTVYFNMNGGDGEQSSLTVTYGQPMPEISTLPTRYGYIFDGYYDPDSGRKYYNSDLSSARVWDIACDLTLYADWRGLPYYVEFNANGASGSMYTQELEHGEYCYLNYNTFTLLGYDFVGWNTASDGSGTAYPDGAYVLDIIDGDGETITLYAQWTPKRMTIIFNESYGAMHSISFDLNGADGIAPETQYITTVDGLEYPAIPTRDGYIFAGWYEDSECTGSPYDFSGDVTESTTLYAKWVMPTGHVGVLSIGGNTGTISFGPGYNYYAFVPLTSQNLRIYTSHTSGDPKIHLFDANKNQIVSNDDGYGSGDSLIDYYVTAGQLYYVAYSCYSTSSGSGVMYISGSDIPADGGTASGISSAELVYGESFTLPIPVHPGYTFIGWYDEPYGAGTQYTGADGVGLRVWDKYYDTALYAHWSANNYEVSFDTNGGEGQQSSINVAFGTQLPDITVTPSRVGYIFLGYFSEPDGGRMYYDGNLMPVHDYDIPRDATLYANWEIITYSLYLENLGGTGSEEETLTYGEGLPYFSAPTKEGYVFLGYFDAELGGAMYYDQYMNAAVTVSAASDLTLYAHWEAETYTVDFDMGGAENYQDSITVTFDAALPELSMLPIRTGYIFLGYWNQETDEFFYGGDLSTDKSWTLAYGTTLYARWEEITYFVSYDANGGSGEVDDQEFTYDSYSDLYGTVFTNTGYVLTGWNTAADGSGTAYALGQSLYNLSATDGDVITLYAQWEIRRAAVTLDQNTTTASSHTVSFDLNGISGTAPEGQVISADVALVYPAIPTASGYIFAGWYTTTDCTGTPFNFAAEVTEDVTLYAKWYSVSYPILTMNGSTGNVSFSSSIRRYAFVPLVDQTIRLYTDRNSGDPKIYLYNANGTQLAVDDDGHSNGNNSLITYTVTAGTLYYAGFGCYSTSSGTGYMYLEGVVPTGGGVSDGRAPLFDEITYGSEFTLEVPTADGYEFLGWYDAQGGEGTQYTGADGVGLFAWNYDGDITLYAYWSANTYDVTLDNTDGEGGDEYIEATFGSSMPEATAPTRVGYVFLGYFTAPEGGVQYYNADMTSTRAWSIAEDTTLYAHWERARYTVNFNNCGGSGTEESTLTYGETLPAISVPTRVGYIFLGYYDAEEDGTRYYNEYGTSDVVWSLEEGITLFAHWQAKTYTVYFNMNGGEGSQESVTVTWGEAMPEITYVPTRVGYTFVGYFFYDDSSYYYNEDLTSDRIWSTDYNVTLYAQWNSNSYTVSFDANGGEGETADQSFRYDNGGYISGNSFVRTGYTFMGWNTAADGSGTRYDVGTYVYNLAAEDGAVIVMYAQWQINVHNVIYDDARYNNNEVEVRFEYQDGYGGYHTVLLDDGDVLEYPSNPVWSGHIFSGWYTDADCTELYSFSGEIYEDMTLYAGWVDCTVSNSGWSVSGTSITSTNKSHSSSSYYTITAGSAMTVSFNYRVSSEQNYDWLRVYHNNTTIVEISGSSSTYYKSVTLNAGDTLQFRYSKDGSVNSGNDCAYITNLSLGSASYIESTAVAVCTDEGEGYIYSDGASCREEVTYGDIHTYIVPTRPGYDFLGWFDADGVMYADANGVATGAWLVDDDVILYARWSGLDYSISYELDGGTNAEGNPDSYSAGDVITLINPTREGYSFLGWTLEGTDEPIKDLVIDYDIWGDLVLTAHWVEYGVGDIMIEGDSFTINVEGELTAENFGATAYDTDGNPIEITVEIVGDRTAGSTVSVVLSATAGDSTVSETIEGVRVYGTPTITYTTNKINVGNYYTAYTFGASATDSFGESLTVQMEVLEGSFYSAGYCTVVFSAEDSWGNEATLEAVIQVYGIDGIRVEYDEIDSVVVGSVGEEFNATATDIFGVPCTVTTYVSSGSTATAGSTVSITIQAVDELGNTWYNTYYDIKVYGTPVATSNFESLTDSMDADGLYTVTDSFGAELEATVAFLTTPTAGEYVTVSVYAVDALGNELRAEYEVYVICTEHTLDAQCVCTVCEVVAHELDGDGFCTACGEQISICDVWDGTVATSFAGGSGTSADPYIIETAEQLAYLAHSINNLGYDYNGMYFRLDADLDLSGYEWTPIGTSNASGWSVSNSYRSFRGNFDGNGKTVYGLMLRNAYYGKSGLFGFIYGATIHDLAVVDMDINITDSSFSTSITGGLCGYGYGSYIYRCYVEGSMVLNYNGAGALGAGGVVGGTNGIIIEDCVSAVEISVSAGYSAFNAYVGGFIGLAQTSDFAIERCVFAGSVYSYSSDSDSGYGAAFVGCHDATTSSRIRNCVSISSITAEQSDPIVNCWSGRSINCEGNYYLSGFGSSSYGSSATSSTLTSESFYVDTLGWSFDSIWTFVPGVDYPMLAIFVD